MTTNSVLTKPLVNPIPCPPDSASTDVTEARHERYHEVLATLESGIAAIVTGEGFARYLHCMARFHAYSPNNIALIHAQRPDATRVAGYRAWQALGRQVRRGERGIRIIVPHRTRVDPEAEGQETIVISGFGVSTVFDLVQTTGNHSKHRRCSARCSGTQPSPRGCGGTDWVASGARHDAHAAGHGTGKRLLPATHPRDCGTSDLAGLRELKTLMHEAAHFAADHIGGMRWEDAETVAESAAYVTLAHFGLDTSGYSFAYVAGWAGNIAVFRRNLAAI